MALGVAARRVASGAKRRVLVLGGDRLGDFVREGFAALRALASDGCRPFDADRTGLTLGETAAAVVLEEDGADHLQGWGAGMDANHLTGPDRNGAGLAAACRQALARGGVVTPALVIAHGTGTRYNDDAESLAYAAVCPTAPVTASKGLLGHSLGACGLADAVLAVHIRRRGVVPGIHALSRRGCPGDIPLLGAGDHRVADGPVLVANAGFGGLNGAILIGAQAPRPLDRVAVAVSARAELDAAGWRCAERRGAWTEPAAGASLPRLGAREVLGAIDASWGRMDLACRALVSLGRLLAPLPADCAIMLLSEHGCAATDRAFEQARRSGAVDPQRFAYTLPSTAVGEASIRLALHGAGMALLGANDGQGRAVADELLAEGASAVLLARIEADRPPHLAWAELRIRA
ncbi:MAG: hypothetical protein H0W72_14320 [Planctomycetes bacterium]|nr:hypothetical protein [Planctomycetota bacterium]